MSCIARPPRLSQGPMGPPPRWLSKLPAGLDMNSMRPPGGPVTARLEGEVLRGSTAGTRREWGRGEGNGEDKNKMQAVVFQRPTVVVNRRSRFYCCYMSPLSTSLHSTPQRLPKPGLLWLHLLLHQPGLGPSGARASLSWRRGLSSQHRVDRPNHRAQDEADVLCVPPSHLRDDLEAVVELGQDVLGQHRAWWAQLASILRCLKLRLQHRYGVRGDMGRARIVY